MIIEHGDGIGRTGRFKALYWKQFWSRHWTQAHLVAEEMQGWDMAPKAICGVVVNHEEAEEAPKATCKRCLNIMASR